MQWGNQPGEGGTGRDGGRSERPVLVFDGECAFCCFWVERWQGVTEGRVEFLPSQEAAARFPDVAPEVYSEAVQLFEGGQLRLSGADAVFRVLEFAALPWSTTGRVVAGVPGGLWLARKFYSWIAAHRCLLGRLTQWFFGGNSG